MRFKTTFFSKLINVIFILLGLTFFIQAIMGFYILPTSTIANYVGFPAGWPPFLMYMFLSTTFWLGMIPFLFFTGLIEKGVLPQNAQSQSKANNLARSFLASFVVLFVSVFLMFVIKDQEAFLNLLLSSFFFFTGLFHLIEVRMIIDPKKNKKVNEVMERWRVREISFSQMNKELKRIDRDSN